MAWCFGVVFLGGGLDGITEGIFGKNLHLNVSAGMGALIAGASLASLPYSTDVLSKVSAVKDFFVTLFFVGLGMGIPMPDGVAVLGLANIGNNGDRSGTSCGSSLRFQYVNQSRIPKGRHSGLARALFSGIPCPATLDPVACRKMGLSRVALNCQK